MSITALRARALDVPMKKAFGIAGGAQEIARNVLVEIELASGERGWGEAAPLPAFNGETQAGALATALALVEEMVGRDAGHWRDLAARAFSAGSACGACAVETAIVDAFARSRGTSLRALFGGAETELVTDITITTGSVDDASREARAFAAFDTLKIKVGGAADHDVDLDVQRVLAVSEARPDARLLLDANGGLSIHAALHLTSALRARGVPLALFEQPVAPGSWDALAEIRAKCGIPVAIDESVTHPDDIHAAHAARAADAANIKIMKSGVARALEIAAAARACGMLPMIGGMVETRLAMGTSASIAAGLGGFAFIDLDTPLFLAEDPFDGGYVQRDARLDLRPITLGHGCVPHARHR
ncbi:MAG: dipeptide epimerase [Labilithrix sp.]|nr:dipeptide epimerase [Labilithrix sp.]